EPVEVSAQVEATAAPTAEPTAAPTVQPTVQPTAEPTPEPAGFQQSADYRLVLVNDEVEIPEDFILTTRAYGGVEVNALMYTDLCAMLDDARDAGHTLWLASGYRSVEKQESILERAVQNRMRSGMTRGEARENALLTIQEPGHSEHHTGLAVDFNRVNYDFENSGAYAWLQEHAAEYGFVERYPEGKESITGIKYEPWHYRYVGREHAEKMNELGMCLEEYVTYCGAL
ncbi:MAG: D-alanyl-D-alanine carboxypeptidase family protein, partial [Clostridia bacterium]|nr:D-alanyl-D-alanine carboxypeptidase family protein [Clostridia bacterium]